MDKDLLKLKQQRLDKHLFYKISPNGFTLIELIVVIAIISLLVALLLPALSRARKAAYGVECLGRERQLAVAAFAYHADHGYYPVNSRTHLGPGIPSMDFIKQLGPYTHPGQPQYDRHENTIWTPPNTARVNFYLCPGGEYYPVSPGNMSEVRKRALYLTDRRVTNYVVNPFFGYRNFTSPEFYGPKKEVIDPNSNVPLMGEAKDDSSWGGDYFPTVMLPILGRAGFYPHLSETTNIVFLDGHAANVGTYDEVVDGYFVTKALNFRPSNHQ